MRWIAPGILLLVAGAREAGAQSWDLPGRAAAYLSSQTAGKWNIGFEQRMRYESRSGNGFGRDPDLLTGLARSRLSLSAYPWKWLKISAMVQDSRAPWYGRGAPNTVRDPADLQEAYIELFPAGKSGFGLSAGREMLNYGEARLIGSPQWSNVSRTFDHVRAWYALRRARFEFLAVSPVKVRLDGFNYPVPGDRVWGTYNSFPEISNGSVLEAYLLRHEQNRPGGFAGGSAGAGSDRLRVNTLGFRLAGPLPRKFRYSLEGALQNGRVGAAAHRGKAWYSLLGRGWSVAGRKLEVSAEYKFASGSPDGADAGGSRTFDQLYPANHDKFGHMDLFGWRNIRNFRIAASYVLAKNLTVNAMFNDSWLANTADSLYNSSGRPVARVADGSAGRHIGQEGDVFGTYRHGHLQFGAGFGYLHPGAFLRGATPGSSPVYLYVFHSYSL